MRPRLKDSGGYVTDPTSITKNFEFFFMKVHIRKTFIKYLMACTELQEAQNFNVKYLKFVQRSGLHATAVGYDRISGEYALKSDICDK